MKLEGLFAIDKMLGETFMNRDLQDFLNVNPDWEISVNTPDENLLVMDAMLYC